MPCCVEYISQQTWDDSCYLDDVTPSGRMMIGDKLTDDAVRHWGWLRLLTRQMRMNPVIWMTRVTSFALCDIWWRLFPRGNSPLLMRYDDSRCYMIGWRRIRHSGWRQLLTRQMRMLAKLGLRSMSWLVSTKMQTIFPENDDPVARQCRMGGGRKREI